MKKELFLPGLLICQMLFSQSVTEQTWNIDRSAAYSVEKIFIDERFPNVDCALDGSIICTWGSHHLRVRKSVDGGVVWEDEIKVHDNVWHGGGVTVDELTGDIFFFIEDKYPSKGLYVYRSQDNGDTWHKTEIIIHSDDLGNMPAMHMNESGLTLTKGPHPGRLIRPTRFFGESNEVEHWHQHYTNAIYSDDRGKTWHTSKAFPAYGTGEAAIVELSDGTLYYNSRRHKSTDGLNCRMRHEAWSYDGGETWEGLKVSDVLPDGPQGHDYGLMGGLIRIPLDEHDILIFSNNDTPGERWQREKGTVWISFDGGRTWPVKKRVEEGGFAYSSLTVGRKGTASDGWIYLLYESIEEGRHAGGKIARFSLSWLLDGRDWREFID